LIAVANTYWTTIKLIWVVSASIGVFISILLLSMAITDARLLIKRHINSWRIYVAHTSTIIFFGGLVGQTVYLFLGVVSMTRPNPPQVDSIQWTELGVFIFAIWFSVWCGVLIFYRRRHIIDKIEKSIEHEFGEHNKERDG